MKLSAFNRTADEILEYSNNIGVRLSKEFEPTLEKRYFAQKTEGKYAIFSLHANIFLGRIFLTYDGDLGELLGVQYDVRDDKNTLLHIKYCSTRDKCAILDNVSHKCWIVTPFLKPQNLFKKEIQLYFDIAGISYIDYELDERIYVMRPQDLHVVKICFLKSDCDKFKIRIFGEEVKYYGTDNLAIDNSIIESWTHRYSFANVTVFEKNKNCVTEKLVFSYGDVLIIETSLDAEIYAIRLEDAKFDIRHVIASKNKKVYFCINEFDYHTDSPWVTIPIIYNGKNNPGNTLNIEAKLCDIKKIMITSAHSCFTQASH